jgi:hypothetical protein
MDLQARLFAQTWSRFVSWAAEIAEVRSVSDHSNVRSGRLLDGLEAPFGEDFLFVFIRGVEEAGFGFQWNLADGAFAVIEAIDSVAGFAIEVFPADAFFDGTAQRKIQKEHRWDEAEDEGRDKDASVGGFDGGHFEDGFDEVEAFEEND